jgi:hypothetical protein
MRHFFIPALTFGISACTPLQHQDVVRNPMQTRTTATDCAGQGRQLDRASGQCVVIPIGRRVASTTSPSRAPTQSASMSTTGAPIEPHAKIDDSLRDETRLMAGMVTLLRSRGYQCNAISSAKPFSTSNGFKLTCDHSRHRYDIEANKGSWDIRVE